MIKHTPGPWVMHRMRIPRTEPDRRCGFVVNGPDGKDANLPVRVCDLRVPQGFGGFAEGEANAHLIAAAPEMLAALERASFELGLCRPGANGQDTADIAGAKELCHQAMLKAKGGSR